MRTGEAELLNGEALGAGTRFRLLRLHMQTIQSRASSHPSEAIGVRRRLQELSLLSGFGAEAVSFWGATSLVQRDPRTMHRCWER